MIATIIAMYRAGEFSEAQAEAIIQRYKNITEGIV